MRHGMRLLLDRPGTHCELAFQSYLSLSLTHFVRSPGESFNINTAAAAVGGAGGSAALWDGGGVGFPTLFNLPTAAAATILGNGNEK